MASWKKRMKRCSDKLGGWETKSFKKIERLKSWIGFIKRVWRLETLKQSRWLGLKVIIERCKISLDWLNNASRNTKQLSTCLVRLGVTWEMILAPYSQTIPRRISCTEYRRSCKSVNRWRGTGDSYRIRWLSISSTAKSLKIIWVALSKTLSWISTRIKRWSKRCNCKWLSSSRRFRNCNRQIMSSSRRFKGDKVVKTKVVLNK